jgi:hypothetical protein
VDKGEESKTRRNSDVIAASGENQRKYVGSDSNHRQILSISTSSDEFENPAQPTYFR